MRACFSFALAVCLAAGAAPLFAQPFPHGPEFQVNGFTTGGQVAPSVSGDAAGNFVVVWVGPYIDGGYFGIGGRLFDSLGNALGADFQVNEWSTGGQGPAEVAMAESGSFAVIWQDGARDGDNVGLFGRAFDSDGTPLGIEFQVNLFTTSRQQRASVAMGASGDFVVVWDSYTQDGEEEGIYGRRFNSIGQPLTAEFLINEATAGRQFDPAVATDGSGQFVVVWESLYPLMGGGYASGLFGKLIDPGGLDLSGEFRINAPPGIGPLSPKVAMDPTGAFVVAWSGGTDGSGSAVLARRFDDLAMPLGLEFQVNTYTTGNNLGTSIGVDETGAFVIAWENTGQDGPPLESGVFGRSYDSAGNPVGGEIQINTYTSDDQHSADISVTPSGDFVVVWADATLDDSVFGIFGRIFFGPATCSLGDPDGDAVCDNFDVCPALYDPGQEDGDADGVGDLCDITLTSPLSMDDLDCSDPAAIQPTMTWTQGQYDQFKVFMGTSAGFEKGTFVASGDRWIKAATWMPPKKKWKKACQKAIAAQPGTPIMYVQVLGLDRDASKNNPARTAFSNTAQVSITD